MVVSQSAGASPDIMARLLANTLSEQLGQGVVVENKPGGGNVIGANAVARSSPDGYTFFFATSAALVGNPYLMKNLTYDPVKDFEPVALVTRSHQVVVVHPGVAAKTLAELIALERASPGKLSIAVDGPRNLAGVTARAFNKRADTQFVLVPYPNINNGVQDTMAGRTESGRVLDLSRRVPHSRRCIASDCRCSKQEERGFAGRDLSDFRNASRFRPGRMVHADGSCRHAKAHC